VTTEFSDASGKIYRTDVEWRNINMKSSSTSSTTMSRIVGTTNTTETEVTKSNGVLKAGTLWFKTDSLIYTYDADMLLLKKTSASFEYYAGNTDTIVYKDSVVNTYDSQKRLTMNIVYNSAKNESRIDSTICKYSTDPNDPSLIVREQLNSLAPIDSTQYGISKYSINADGQIVAFLRSFFRDDLEVYKFTGTYEYDKNGHLTRYIDSTFTQNYIDVDVSFSHGFSYKYIFNDNEQISQIISSSFDEYDSIPRESYANYTYLQDAKAESVAIHTNQTISVNFNYELDAEADISGKVILRNNDSDLSIKHVSVNPDNNKQLIIVLNKQIATDRSFEIATTENIPLKYGRTVAIDVKIDSQTPTSDTEAAVSPLEITQTANFISISSGSEIVNVRIFSAIGVQVFSANPQSLDFSISVQDLPSGIYQISAVDAAGRTVSETVSF